MLALYAGGERRMQGRSVGRREAAGARSYGELGADRRARACKTRGKRR